MHLVNLFCNLLNTKISVLLNSSVILNDIDIFNKYITRLYYLFLS